MSTQPRIDVRRHLLNDDIFRTVIARERNRSDRSNAPFLMLLVRARNGNRTSIQWPLVFEALSSAAHERDMIGWFRRGDTLALIEPDVDGTPLQAASQLRMRVGRELAAHLNGTSADVSVELRAYPGIAVSKADGVQPLEPLLEECRPAPWRNRVRDLAKRTLDIAGSLVLLIALAPVLALAAALVKYKSKGPFLFRQLRIGEKGKPFYMLKFRTMHVNVDDTIHQQYVSWFIRNSGHDGAGESGVFKLTNDPRITAMGCILRKTSLDELPQLWNVLRGDMSLVGPRPPLPYEVQQYQPWHYRRVMDARPGITGLWQVEGRSRTTFDEMVRLDLRYARTHTIVTDLKILLATPRAVISGKGAC